MRCTDALAWLRDGWYIVAATILMVTQPFLTSMTRNDKGQYDYLIASTVLMSETAKLSISLSFYVGLSAQSRTHRLLRVRDALLFAIPAFVYFLNNNLLFLILIYVSTTTFQVLSAMKTVFTGILFRVVLKRILSEVQATSILVLACGAAVSQFPLCVCSNPLPALLSNHTNADDADLVEAASPLIGATLIIVACLLSAFAGVYSELLLKKDGMLHSIHLQNLLLYSWGIIFNGGALFWHDYATVASVGLFRGYTPAVWLLILNNALVGLAISAIFKFANNIVRVFAHTGAMVLTMFLEAVFTDTPLSAQLVVSVTIVGASTFLYNREPPPRPKAALIQSQQIPSATEDDYLSKRSSTASVPTSRSRAIGDQEDDGL